MKNTSGAVASHFNMFSMYIALTKGQQRSFKDFLSGRNKTSIISDKFLSDQQSCFRLFHCFYEAGDDNICKAIERSEVFNNKEIDLNSNMLQPYDVECVALFLASSCCKSWMELDLCKCFIQDHGLKILHHRLCHCSGTSITIDNLWLDNNGLTVQSLSLISEIIIKCKV